ncbi:glycosyltransferase 87 family protein [Salininema proteolyticum]|uniref:Glycosyltransferase 87 family protein n=1 Tax=Salininema proteolyticum TaxID=1607685 RepID=A0ABV8TTC3_9ACTN
MTHRASTARPVLLDIALYGAAALFAIATAAWSTLPPHQDWGFIAVGGYLPAALIAFQLYRLWPRPWKLRALLAGGVIAAVSLLPLIGALLRRNDPGAPVQEEVPVIEDSARRVLDGTGPYLTSDQIAASSDPLLAYNPYQPGMALFGIPAALGGQHWWTDPRLYFAAVTLAALVGATALLNGRAGKGPLIRAWQAALVFPACALNFTVSTNDIAIASLMVLALALADRERWALAGAVAAFAASLKLFALPLLAVLFVLAWRRGRLRGYLSTAVPLAALVAASVWLSGARAWWENTISFGFGDGVVPSPAQSPFPGNLIAQHLPQGEAVSAALLGLAAAAVAAGLLWKRPGDAATAALWLAGGLTAAFLLMPATRFGYVVYPVILLGWWLVLRDRKGPAFEADPSRGARIVEWWR